MKKRIQKYLSGEREGFSLVELIIVIAIMAILIGVIALAVLPYLESSRESKDKQTLDTVYSAFTHALADEDIAKANKTVNKKSSAFAADDALKLQMEKYMGITLAEAANKLVSENCAGGEFQFVKDGTLISVSVVNGSGIAKDGDNKDFTSSNGGTKSGS